VYNILIGKPEEKKPLGKPGCRCKNNIKMDLSEIGLEIVDLIDVVQICEEFLDWLSDCQTFKKESAL
jgi:hypothetical protein